MKKPTKKSKTTVKKTVKKTLKKKSCCGHCACASTERPRTQVFAHKGIIGISSNVKSQGLLNDPTQEGQLGFVLQAKFLDVSKEAFDALKKVRRSADDIGDVDVFQSNTQGVIFGWLGGSKAMIIPDSEQSGSRKYDANLLLGVATVIKNEPPAEFISVVEDYLKNKETKK